MYFRRTLCGVPRYDVGRHSACRQQRRPGSQATATARDSLIVLHQILAEKWRHDDAVVLPVPNQAARVGRLQSDLAARLGTGKLSDSAIVALNACAAMHTNFMLLMRVVQPPMSWSWLRLSSEERFDVTRHRRHALCVPPRKTSVREFVVRVCFPALLSGNDIIVPAEVITGVLPVGAAPVLPTATPTDAAPAGPSIMALNAPERAPAAPLPATMTEETLADPKVPAVTALSVPGHSTVAPLLEAPRTEKVDGHPNDASRPHRPQAHAAPVVSRVPPQAITQR